MDLAYFVLAGKGWSHTFRFSYKPIYEEESIKLVVMAAEVRMASGQPSLNRKYVLEHGKRWLFVTLPFDQRKTLAAISALEKRRHIVLSSSTMTCLMQQSFIFLTCTRTTASSFCEDEQLFDLPKGEFPGTK